MPEKLQRYVVEDAGYEASEYGEWVNGADAEELEELVVALRSQRDDIAAELREVEGRKCGNCHHWEPDEDLMGWGECEPLWDAVKILTVGAVLDDVETPESFKCPHWKAKDEEKDA